MELNNLKHELANLKDSYSHELDTLLERANAARSALLRDGRVSSHDAFNMSANCQNLAVLAGKIEQTANVVRWMEAE